MPDIALALLALLPLTAVELAKAARWRALFGVHRPSYAVALRALVAGQVTNALSPVRAGDAVRLGVLSAQGGALVPGAAALAGAKAIDAVCLAAIAFATAGATVFSRRNVGLLLGVLVIVAGICVALWGQGLRERLDGNRITRKLRLSALVDVAQTLRDPNAFATVALATLVVWLAGMLANVCILAAVGIVPDATLASRMIVAAYLVGLVPSPPAQVGTIETAITAALATAGVPLTPALAASVTFHIGHFVKLALLSGLATLLLLPTAREHPLGRWLTRGT